MPKYTYLCNECGVLHEVFHDMKETLEECPECKSTENLEKKPSFFSLGGKQAEKKQTGDLVKEAINNFRKELEQQKKDLRKEYVGKDK